MVSAARSGYERVEPNLRELGNAFVCHMNDELRRDLQKRGKSSLFIPMTPTVALKIYTSIITTYYANPDLATISPDDPDDPLATEAAEAIQETLRYYDKHKILNLFPVLSREILNATVYLACAVKVYWDGDAPRVDGIKLRDLWFDSTSTCIRDAQYLVHRMYIPRHRAEELGGVTGFMIPAALTELGAADGVNEWNKRQPCRYQLIEVFDIYERAGGDWQLSTLMGGQIVRDGYPLRDGFPIFVGRLMPQLVLPGEYDAVEMYGSSPMEYLLPLQTEMNQLRNQQLDALRLQLEPRQLIARGSGVNPFTFYSSKIISIMDVNQIKELKSPDISQSQGGIAQLQLEAQEVSAVTPYNTGATVRMGNETATGTAILSHEANQRLNVYTHSFNETLLEPAMAHLAKLVWRYGRSRFLDKVGLPRGTDPELFVHVNTGMGATSPVVRAQQLREAMSTLSSLGEERGVRELARQLLKMLGIKNIGEYISNEQTAEQPDGSAVDPAGNDGAGAAFEGAAPESSDGGPGVADLIERVHP